MKLDHSKVRAKMWELVDFLESRGIPKTKISLEIDRMITDIDPPKIRGGGKPFRFDLILARDHTIPGLGTIRIIKEIRDKTNLGLAESKYMFDTGTIPGKYARVLRPFFTLHNLILP